MRLLALLLFAATVGIAPPASATPSHGTRDEAVAMVKRVDAEFHKDGAAKTFKDIDDKSVKTYHDRDLYPFVYDMTGKCVAHGARPALIGKNLIDLKDQDGKFLIREMIALAKGPGSGWVDYKWPNPITNKIEDKSSYVEKMGKYFVGVGIYKQ
jgi:signal transduction histidine kinase